MILISGEEANSRSRFQHAEDITVEEAEAEAEECDFWAVEDEGMEEVLAEDEGKDEVDEV